MRDADIEQAEYEETGRAIARAIKRGECVHGSVIGTSSGKQRCTAGCGRTFDSMEAWIRAMREVIA